MGYVGGLANAQEAHGSPMARKACQWDDDDPSCGEQAATPHPISVYSKLSDCQANQGYSFVR